MSIPGIRGLVPRSKKIKLKYTDRNNRQVTAEYSDFIARIIQHEIDHLDGIVFLDRLTSTKDIITDKEFFRLVGQSTLSVRKPKLKKTA